MYGEHSKILPQHLLILLNKKIKGIIFFSVNNGADSPILTIHSGQIQGKKSASIFKTELKFEIKADMVFPTTGAKIMWKGLSIEIGGNG